MAVYWNVSLIFLLGKYLELLFTVTDKNEVLNTNDSASCNFISFNMTAAYLKFSEPVLLVCY